MKKTAKNRKLNKKFYAVIAMLLVLVVAGGTIFAVKNTAYAKETLLGIEHIRDKAMSGSGTTFTILEIVPTDGIAGYSVTDPITGEKEVVEGVRVYTPYNENGSEHMSSENPTLPEDREIQLVNNAEKSRSDATFSTGTAGFYVKGQEPIFKDWVRILSDASGENGASLLTDSYARKYFAGAETGLTAGNAGGGRGMLQRLSILTRPKTDETGIFYEDTITGYHELRLGETIGRDVNGDGKAEVYATPSLMSQLVTDSKYFEIGHTCTGDNAYIDLAEGLMRRTGAGEKGNFVLSYIPKLTESATDPNLKELDKLTDKGYQFVTGVSGTTEPINDYFALSNTRGGIYDPNLIYGEAQAPDVDSFRATFAYVKGAESGYMVKKNTLADKWVEEAEDFSLLVGTPLYTYDDTYDMYVLAGFYDHFDETENKIVLETLEETDSKTDVVGLTYPKDLISDKDRDDEEDDVDPSYYVLEFEYSEAAVTTSKYYQVSYFDKGAGIATQKTGTNYYVNDTVAGALVQNTNGTGLIDLKDNVPSNANDSFDSFVFDYALQKGNFNWTSDTWLSASDVAKKKLYRIRGAKMYFTAGVINNDKFRKEVFDLEDGQCSKFPIVVKTIAASDVTTADVNAANLVVMHRGSEVFSYTETTIIENETILDTLTDLSYKKGEQDISEDVLKTIVGRVVNEGFPVVSQFNVKVRVQEQGADKEIEQTELDSKNPLPIDTPNIYYLTRALALENMEGYYRNVLLSATGWNAPLQYSSLIREGMQWDGNVNHVNKSAFNVTLSNQSPAYGFLNIDFTKQVSNMDGYELVLQNIQSENIYRMASGSAGRIKETVSLATIIRYIIAYADSMNFEANGSLHILEIAPCASYTMQLETTKDGDKEKITLYKILEKNPNGEVVKREELISYEGGDITLTQMTSSEFIGHIEDINAHYDLVYISSDIGPYKLPNGKIVELDHNDQYETRYNDGNMNGLIYTNIGDQMNVVQIGSYQENEANRFSGNDITQEKQRALEAFVEAGFPIVVSNQLLELDTGAAKEDGKRTPLKVNTNTVDNSSYMYRLLQDIRERENVYLLSEVSAPLLNLYFSISRPVLHLVDDSLCANSQTEAQRLTILRDGYARAVFEFSVESRGIGGSEADYDLELFIDINADGKFSKTTEKITSFDITDFAGNAVYKDEDGRYELRPGATYRATYMVSSAQRGVLPWKLLVTRNDGARLKRADAIGYYELRDPDGKLEKVNVLQIDTNSTASGGAAPSWNMENTLADSNTQFSKLLSNHEVVPFDVSIDTIPSDKLTIEEIQRRYSEGKLCVDAKLEDSNRNGRLDIAEYLDFFRNYDMLVIGFADVVATPTGDALQAIRLYIEEGRSVLLTHDTTSPYSLPGHYGIEYNQVMRDLLGMDRYNITGQRSSSGEETFDLDRPYEPKRHRENVLSNMDQGHTYSVMVRKNGGANQLMIQEGIRNTLDHVEYDNGKRIPFDYTEYRTSKVDFVNKGQITTYPYVIDQKSFTIAETHGQYWQLDFTKDEDKDGESDLVVWYTLDGTDLYGLSPKDVRNNYYIYNMRNVTYSGVGHSSVMGTDGTGINSINEIKLFINTLIASYESGLHAPSVRIIENYKSNSRDVNTIYLSYDEQLKEWENATVSKGVIDGIEDIYFVADTTSLVRSSGGRTHTFNANLYMEVPELSGSEKLQYKGEVLYGRKLAIDGLYYLGADRNEIQVTANGDGSYPITPGVVYKARISIAALKYYSNGTAVFDEEQTPVDPSDISSARNARNVLVTATEKIRMNSSGIETEATAIDGVAFVRVRLFDLD